MGQGNYKSKLAIEFGLIYAYIILRLLSNNPVYFEFLTFEVPIKSIGTSFFPDVSF